MTQPYPSVHYPSYEAITPHGWYYLTQGNQPTMRLKSFDGSIDMFLVGGHAIPDRYSSPERIQVPRDGLKGLIAPWKHIDQKGATQDGVSQLDALYDPIEIQLDAVCYGRDGRHLFKVVRDLIASLDAKQTAELGFLSHDEGYWWSDVRWFQGAPVNPVVLGGQRKTQKLSLRLRADNGFWRTYAYTDQFQFTYDALVEDFNYTDDTDLGPNWPQYFYEAEDGAEGLWVTSGTGAKWTFKLGTAERSSVALRKDFTTTTDYQVINLFTDKIAANWYPETAFNDVWGRCNADPATDLWDGDGIRLRIGRAAWNCTLELAYYKDFNKTVMSKKTLLKPPWWGDRWTLILGDEDNPRLYRVQRNGSTVMTKKEVGTDSLMDADHRYFGFGGKGGRTYPDQPANIRKITVGDNSTVAQSGFVQLINPGDQPMHYELTLFGPFSTCKVWNGPGAADDEYVTFGPATADQVVVLRTDPKLRPLADISAVPSTVNLYKYLDGRFSDDAAIPPKVAGVATQPYYVKVQIDDGNADSRVVASGVPLRRWPL